MRSGGVGEDITHPVTPLPPSTHPWSPTEIPYCSPCSWPFCTLFQRVPGGEMSVQGPSQFRAASGWGCRVLGIKGGGLGRGDPREEEEVQSPGEHWRSSLLAAVCMACGAGARAGRRAPRLCEGGQGVENLDLQGIIPEPVLLAWVMAAAAPLVAPRPVSAHRPTGWSRWHGPAVGVGLAAPWQPGQLGQGQS